MRGKGLLIAAVATIVVGLLGIGVALAWLAVSGPSADVSPPSADRDERRMPGPRGRGPGGFSTDPDDYDSPGERIFVTGIGAEGGISRDPTYGPSMMGGCATCHGIDGRGRRFRMMGTTYDAPDIRYRTLTSEHGEDGEREPGWSDADIAKAVRTGVEPSGETLDTSMPRWDISDEDFADLLAHLKTLD